MTTIFIGRATGQAWSWKAETGVPSAGHRGRRARAPPARQGHAACCKVSSNLQQAMQLCLLPDLTILFTALKRNNFDRGPPFRATSLSLFTFRY